MCKVFERWSHTDSVTVNAIRRSAQIHITRTMESLAHGLLHNTPHVCARTRRKYFHRLCHRYEIFSIYIPEIVFDVVKWGWGYISVCMCAGEHN